MYVRDVLSDKGNEVFSVSPETSTLEFVQMLVENRIGAALVIENGKVVGVMSERDIVYCLAKNGADCLTHQVRDLMTEEVHTCSLDTTIAEVMNQMTRRRIRHLPVMDGDKLVGVISIGDVVKYRIAEAEREANELREYITA